MVKNIVQRRTKCRACDSSTLNLVFSLSPTPIGDAFVTLEQVEVPQPSYPIDLYMCQKCGLAQLLDIIDPAILYENYLYVTASSMGLGEHFNGYANRVTDRCGLAPGSLVVDVGSNDGTLLSYFKERGMSVLGVEPASDIAAKATLNGIPTIGDFFTPDLAKKIVAKQGRAAVVTANNVFANIDDLQTWVYAIDELLADNGVFVFESYYLPDLLQNMVFDFLYHEHLSAFSVKPIQVLFERGGLVLVAVERVPTKGGSLRYFVQRLGGPIANDGSVEKILAMEVNIGLYQPAIFSAFADKIDNLKKETNACLSKIKAEGKSIAGFGASITGTTLIYHFQIGNYLDFLVDDNPTKQGRFSPGLHLPVLPSAALYERKPDYVVILAWRYAAPFIAKHKAYLESGGRFLIPVPEFKVITND